MTQNNTQTNANTMTVDQLKAEIARLQAEQKALKAAQGNLSLKVSEKGAVSVYGLGRFPVTLYSEQWTRLLKGSEQIIAFIEAHKADLKVKGQE